MKSIAIVGAGLAGRLLAFELADRGWQVELFDKDEKQGAGSCTWASAGMLAPSCELETAEQEISLLGQRAFELWPDLVARFERPVYHERRGSLVVAHPSDREELARLRDKISAHSESEGMMQDVGHEEIAELEPALGGRFHHGLYMPQEGHVANRDVLKALAHELENRDVIWHSDAEINELGPSWLEHDGERKTFDWVANTRGMGAVADLKDLRGVRGEILLIEAPEVELTRPVRLMHPRYSIYIVPRPSGQYIVGATQIESTDFSPISVRSMLELLTAAYTVHTGFAEGRILESMAQCRPAFPDNRPRIEVEQGLLRINGLYRHGFLLSPILIQFAVDELEGKARDPQAEPLVMRDA